MDHNFITTGIVIVVLTVVLVLLLPRLKRQAGGGRAGSGHTGNRGDSSQPEDVWRGLRDLVFSLKPESLGVTPGSPDACGFVMEMGHQRGGDVKVTVVALRDGTMSLYLSTGGGILGTGQRSAEAAQFARDAVAATGTFVDRLARTETFPVAATGRVRFFVMTGQGAYTAETDLAAVAQQNDPLFPLFAAGQNVMTQIRLVSTETQQQQDG